MDALLPNLLKYFKAGKIEIKENGKKSVSITSEGNRITINLIDLAFNIPHSTEILKKLSEARELADNLKENNLTLCIANKNKLVLKLGKDAKPKLSRMITKSSAVEITDLRELRKMDKRLRLK
jgi:hypothetical protein